MVTELLEVHPVYQKIFNEVYEYTNLQPEEKTAAENTFKDVYPAYPDNFEVFYHRWNAQQIQLNLEASEEDNSRNETCPGLVYDAGQRKYLKAQVLPPQRRRKPEKFNLAECVMQKRAKGDYFQVNLMSRDQVTDMMDDLNEDKTRNDQRADIALNRIVQLAAVWNNTCPNRIVELHAERRVY